MGNIQSSTIQYRGRFLVLSVLIMTGLAAVVFAASVSDGNVERRIVPVELDNISGLSFDGQLLWVTVDGAGQLYGVDPTTGNIERTLDFAIAETGGSAWDGRALWQLAYLEETIYRIDLESGEILDRIPAPGEGICSGMTYDGAYLWLANNDEEVLYQIDPANGGQVVQTLEGDFETTGLAWDGQHLWNGVLVGTTEDHDAPAPYTGFVQERDLEQASTLRVLPVQGVFAGGSDWTPGQVRMQRMWWYDGYHGELIEFSFERRESSWQGMAVLLGLANLFAAAWVVGGREVV